jgi:hypothetical protein
VGYGRGTTFENVPFELNTFRSLKSLKLGGREMDLMLGGNAIRLLNLSE